MLTVVVHTCLRGLIVDQHAPSAVLEAPERLSEEQKLSLGWELPLGLGQIGVNIHGVGSRTDLLALELACPLGVA
jgi:hypothetical protein